MSAANKRTKPDYMGLVKFLVTPFLESPEALSVDCEEFNNQQRVWLRLAFKAEDKGKVYGRGGRNIQAIRTLLQTSATIAGQTLSLEIIMHGRNSSEGAQKHIEDSETPNERRITPPTEKRREDKLPMNVELSSGREGENLAKKPRNPRR